MATIAPAIDHRRQPFSRWMRPGRWLRADDRTNCRQPLPLDDPATEVTGRYTFPPGSRPAQAARRAVRLLLLSRELCNEDWLSDVELVVAELVGNAVRHAGGCTFFKVQINGRRVTVTVADQSTTPPRHQPHTDDGGRGLTLIEALSDQWGIRVDGHGKQVWAQLPPHP